MSVEADARAAYIAETVAAAPPLRAEQIDLIAVILAPVIRPGQDPYALREPSHAELERQRKAKERADAMKAAKKLAESLTACDVCGLQPEVHDFQRSYGTFHDWEPGRAKKLMGGAGV